ncbi:unnamed protein product [Ceutorhynchus assimilis]|uniref:Uncharacterized protein n=1 Tax=Ceutorhynchus assimilis TaxID=467358 RepID=A0A9N9MC08_9CUCU|nr:unnamed protein product [Ceutorhynchus assimilis]
MNAEQERSIVNQQITISTQDSLINMLKCKNKSDSSIINVAGLTPPSQSGKKLSGRENKQPSTSMSDPGSSVVILRQGEHRLQNQGSSASIPITPTQVQQGIREAQQAVLSEFVQKPKGDPTIPRENGGWQNVTYKRRKPRVLVGNKDDTELNIRAVPKSVDLHVYRLHPDTTSMQITNLLKSLFPEVKTEKIESKNSNIYASFKVTILQKNFNKAMDATVWPVNTCTLNNSKIGELEVFLNEFKDIKLICINEICAFKDSILHLNISGFYLASAFCRTHTRGGGAGIWCRQDLQTKEISLSDLCVEGESEICAVQFRNNNNQLFIVICCYRPPSVNMEVMEYENEEHSSELEEASTRSEALVELNEPGPSKNIQSDAKLSKITGDCETSDPFSIFIHTSGGRPEPQTRPLHLENINVNESISINPLDPVKESANSTDIASNNFGNIKLPQTLKTPSIDNNITDAATSLLPSTSKRCISDFLTMPDKPQSYQENFEAKRALKLKEENEKLERKRLREEKAAAKANLETKRVRKSADGITNGNCFLQKIYIHRHCVPKKHKNHVPDLEDDDLFMCHICYKEDSDDGADSEDFDENEEEDSLEIDQNKNDNDLNDTNSDEKKKTDENEEEEIDKLFSLYKDECAKYY